MAAINFATQDEYRTPKNIVDLFGPFDYDPATTKEYAAYHNIHNYDTIQTDGLRADWSSYKKIWINPPFSKKFDFLGKAVKSNKNVFILLPISALTTKKFATTVTCGYTLYLPDGRIKFSDGKNIQSSPPFGSIILRLWGDKRIVKHFKIPTP